MSHAKPARAKAREVKGAAVAAATTPREIKNSRAKASAASAEAGDLIRHISSTAARHARDYNALVIAFARANTASAADFAHQFSNVTSPLEFLQLSNAYSRWQYEALTAQTKALAELAQKMTKEPTTAAPADGLNPTV
jgi:hypothetical protein